MLRAAGISLLLLLTVMAAATAKDKDHESVYSWPFLNVSTKHLELAFDVEHGGVLVSILYDGVEMLAGERGRWSSVDLLKQFAPSDGTTCTNWGSLFGYQFDYGNVTGNVTVTDAKNGLTVNVKTALGVMSWEISKNAPTLSLAITPEPGLLPYYLYIPLAKENATLDIHAFKGWTRALTDTTYCNSVYGASTLVRYAREGDRKRPPKRAEEHRMTIGSSHVVPVAYYSLAAESTWLLHYPIPPAGKYALRFHFQHKKGDKP